MNDKLKEFFQKKKEEAERGFGRQLTEQEHYQLLGLCTKWFHSLPKGRSKYFK